MKWWKLLAEAFETKKSSRPNRSCTWSNIASISSRLSRSARIAIPVAPRRWISATVSAAASSFCL